MLKQMLRCKGKKGEIMEEILISIRPKWCKKMLNGEKRLEVRKSAPKSVPAKVYIYCTKCKDTKKYSDEIDIPLDTKMWMGNGKVIAEFTLNCVEVFEGCSDLANLVEKKKCCLTMQEVLDYSKGRDLYGWHIENLKIYDEPKELREFGLSRPPQSWLYIKK